LSGIFANLAGMLFFTFAAKHNLTENYMQVPEQKMMKKALILRLKPDILFKNSHCHAATIIRNINKLSLIR